LLTTPSLTIDNGTKRYVFADWYRHTSTNGNLGVCVGGWQ
jgi:hypothetical protein